VKSVTPRAARISTLARIGCTLLIGLEDPHAIFIWDFEVLFKDTPACQPRQDWTQSGNGRMYPPVGRGSPVLQAQNDSGTKNAAQGPTDGALAYAE